MIVLAIVASSAPSVIVVAQTDVALVVHTPGLSVSVNGVPRITTWAEPTLYR
jgi:hypothetical protein